MPRKRNSQQWKSAELETAKMLGAVRNASNGQRNADIDKRNDDTPLPYAIEHKLTDKLPEWLREAIQQAVQGVTGDKRPIVVIVTCKGTGHKKERFVLTRWQDFPWTKTGQFMEHSPLTEQEVREQKKAGSP